MSVSHNVRGMTMIEMMVTLAILATIVTLGLPNIQDFISRQGVVNEGNRLLADMRYARVEAARRGDDVRVCSYNANVACDGSPACACRTGGAGRAYRLGWLVFIDENDDEIMNTADGDVLLRVGARTSRENLRLRGSNLTRGGFKFSQSGALHADSFDGSNNGVAFVSCDNFASTATVPGRRIIVRPAGNFITEKMADGDSCAMNTVP